MPNITEILQRVGKIIKKNTNKDIAMALNSSPTTCSNWKGRNAIPYEELFSFAKKHNVSLDWLFTGKEPQRDCAVKCDIEMQEICLKVKELIKSKTNWGESLRSNIESFKKGFDNEKHIDNIKGTSSVGQKSGMVRKKHRVRKHSQMTAENVLDLTSELTL